MKALGIDIGGSGIKGAVVDTTRGKLETERYRIKTPDPSTPGAMGRVVARIVSHFDWSGPIGCGMPGPIVRGKIMTATNIDKSWIGVTVHRVFEKACRSHVTVMNDADAAGLAEMRFGAGKHQRGVVVLITLGTGIGSALFLDGKLLPNTEFGQIEIRGKHAELRASARVRKEKSLSWKEYADRLNEYLQTLEVLLWPDLIIVGGGVSSKSGQFLHHLRTAAKIVPADLRNEAGIIGAAVGAVEHKHD